ncbi:phosphonate/organophosphate ester transporter subunit [Vibrio nigripulchritudo ATCC 27043]|uniref:phosphonate ABC transporter ATP-binding protein n=1 Tax=Vibrio nigripulchritudo TaxID=28173 RepID=UPI00021C3790|nr:phosphonate ABC transporter ATP-binding protein [Vibrio nigripulchritudo]EGU60755.1 phosphonate/organophosphate ester transporter subunit [Vibrio nigripulchritudo ATCC 27043]
MDSIVTVTDLNKTFGKNRALNSINLDLTHRGMTALLGPSGSGKSTLLRHLNGLMAGDKTDASGDIRIMGQPVQQSGKVNKQIRTTRSQAGFIFQQFNLVNRLSVMTNVLIGALSETPWWRTVSGQFTIEQKRKALEALDRVGMASFAHQRVSTLSGGQQQRVAIARALMQDAKIIFADEPIASLDPESSRVVMELLQQINQQENIPVIVTLHQVEHALNYCEHVIALRDGHIFYQGSSNGLTSSQLEALYRGKTEEAGVIVEGNFAGSPAPSPAIELNQPTVNIQSKGI